MGAGYGVYVRMCDVCEAIMQAIMHAFVYTPVPLMLGRLSSQQKVSLHAGCPLGRGTPNFLGATFFRSK